MQTSLSKLAGVRELVTCHTWVGEEHDMRRNIFISSYLHHIVLLGFGEEGNFTYYPL